MRGLVSFALCVATGACISEGFGPEIDWGNGPLTGGNSSAVVPYSRASLESATADQYVKVLSFSGAQAVTPDRFLVGPTYYVGRRSITTNASLLMVPMQNSGDEARCFVRLLEIGMWSGSTLLGWDDGIYLTGSVGVQLGVPTNTCLAPNEQGWVLVPFSDVSFSSVDRVTFSGVEFDAGEQDERWQQAAAALIPTGASYSSGTLSVSFVNQGQQGAMPNVSLSTWMVRATNGVPLAFGFFTYSTPAGVIGIGETGELIDEDLFSGFRGPVVDLEVFTGFTDEALIDR